MRRLRDFVSAHFECLFYGYLWANAAALAALVGRPGLGAIGGATVLPFLLLYAWRVRRGSGATGR